ncbi:MAG TPA: transcription antitermination factor NusB, partial [Jatrophihabitans sp.]|nr:transcription antitermination factor NusB [Jatrophihabitans sp.]
SSSVRFSRRAGGRCRPQLGHVEHALRKARVLPERRRAGRAPADPARVVAYELLRTVAEQDAYANLALPRLLEAHHVSGRDAALATELGYGTLRALGTLDDILRRCVDRPLADVESGVLDLLRLGAYQALRTRVPPHAAVATTVDLAHAVRHGRAAGFVNAVLRRVVTLSWDAWLDELTAGASELGALAVRTSHPEWIAAAFAQALNGDMGETERALAADDARPRTHLVAWPGLITRDELLAQAEGEPGPYSPYAVRMSGGDPGSLPAVRGRRAGVQDEGSQLCALAFAAAPLEGRDERWLDLCAGPGGKAALLAALAAGRGATLTANELREHRAELVRRVTRPWSVDVRVGDARQFPPAEGGFDRVLLDAPCTGLGALRRRPEARWRRRPDDVPELAQLQRELLDAALRLARPGGVVAYVTCSPHPAETTEIIAGHDLLDARPAFADVPELGAGPTVQLWPHRHGTDAMFCALLRRPS